MRWTTGFFWGGGGLSGAIEVEFPFPLFLFSAPDGREQSSALYCPGKKSPVEIE